MIRVLAFLIGIPSAVLAQQGIVKEVAEQASVFENFTWPGAAIMVALIIALTFRFLVNKGALFTKAKNGNGKPVNPAVNGKGNIADLSLVLKAIDDLSIKVDRYRDEDRDTHKEMFGQIHEQNTRLGRVEGKVNA